MNHREFLALGAAAAVTTAIPLVELAPVLQSVTRPIEVRFVRMYDPIIAKIITRFDVLYGPLNLKGCRLGLALPAHCDAADVIVDREHGIPEETLARFIDRCSQRWLGSSSHKVVASGSCVDGDWVQQMWEVEGVEFVG